MLHLVVPSGFAERPSGGNVYDRRVQAGLVGLGWDVVTHEVADADSLAAVLPGLPDGAVVLVDGLVGSRDAELLLPEAHRLRLVLLVHMPLRDPARARRCSRAAAGAWSRPATGPAAGWSSTTASTTPACTSPCRAWTWPTRCRAPRRVASCSASAAVTRAKGHDVLLAALAGLRDLDWRCTLVGTLDLDPDFVDELRTAAADAGIAERVVFAGPLRARRRAGGVRRRGRAGPGLPRARPTGWWSPRRWPTGCR